MFIKTEIFFRPKCNSPANCNKHRKPLRFNNYFLLLGMTDVHDPSTRSYNMSQIKGKNTKPELLVRKFLFTNGFRYRLNVKTLPGKPDIVLPKYKTVIFVNGCFWHGHKGCRYFVLPKTRTEWWLEKIKGTWKRDKEAEIKLNVLGWKVITVWGCELKSDKLQDTLQALASDFQKAISSRKTSNQ